MVISWESMSTINPIFKIIINCAKLKFMNHKEYLTNDVTNVKNASFVNDPAERAVMKFKKAITIYDIEDEQKKIVLIMNVFNNKD
ncbi:hypothetical protein A3Q56_05241 [Intoshia linei]|uniref:Uncharacterized protein n=1 Tax=Intoshia linei TaxID=1819745 RepID=A0A177B079_9BILA|nr:hypothetical protein A3Q56_05241 [Intoshia linei]